VHNHNFTCTEQLDYFVKCIIQLTVFADTTVGRFYYSSCVSVVMHDFIYYLEPDSRRHIKKKLSNIRAFLRWRKLLHVAIL